MKKTPAGKKHATAHRAAGKPDRRPTRREAEHSIPEPSTAGIDPLAKARARGISLRGEILARDDMLTLAEAAQVLGLTPAAVTDRFRAEKLIALQGAARRGRRYPAWQFREELAGGRLDAVLDALTGHSSWTIHRFFTTPDNTLEGGTPLEVLRRGDLEAVLEAAVHFASGEQGGH